MKQRTFTAILILIFASFAIQAVQPTIFSAAGVIESTIGGFKFPDGTVQESAAAPPGCTAITFPYLPYVITSKGVYCVTEHLVFLSATGNAIEIQAHDVTIDLNGFLLEGSPSGVTDAVGIFANNVRNITIRNGSIRGFYRAISLGSDDPDNGGNHLIEDITTSRNIHTGIWVQGEGIHLRRNKVYNTGPSGAVTENYGVYLQGPSGRILNNDIIRVHGAAPGDFDGIHLFEAGGAVVEGNRLDNLWCQADGCTGNSLQIVDSNNVLVVGNRISNNDNGITYTNSTGKYRDNLTSGVISRFNIPTTGVVDAGGNN